MLKMKLLAVGLASVMAVGCASTSTTDTADNRASRNFEFEVVDDNDKVTHICRNERATGSNIGRRTCRTTEQIESDRAEARLELERAQGSLVEPPPGG
ncbi:hypothetical protein SAMN06297280_2833 [Arsukibacterium tuosuense]|uniref:Uncharacterized protein n=1 Tax=Arsukibacterium tuosuense TaxID=1323745 RepID=A0A285J7H4_9GAMM|nr:hypothetical protein [Arsukibacterium tuosuense]SNY55296.1 hypothetical protein SAMN06297280_2833 [Arsukibacterium tuosuense]